MESFRAEIAARVLEIECLYPGKIKTLAPRTSEVVQGFLATGSKIDISLHLNSDSHKADLKPFNLSNQRFFYHKESVDASKFLKNNLLNAATLKNYRIVLTPESLELNSTALNPI